MDRQELEVTPIWELYEKGRNYHRLTGIYRDTDINYNMYNQDQWAKAKMGDVPHVQKNFIRPIVRYKVGVVHDNLYAIVYSSQNFENKEFREYADKVCEMLNRRAARTWEADKMDLKGRRISKDAAINDEGIMYVNFDKETKNPKNEIVKKNDVYYGNENDDDIQSQPYILVRKRMPVINARDMAKENGVSEDKIKYITGDNDTSEESGEAAKQEIDDMVTVITKMYKKNGTVHFAVATKLVELKGEKDSGLTYYPLAHMIWEEKEGSARGEGEVRCLVDNQLEVNRTEVRRILTVQYQSYPQRVVDTNKVKNPEDLNTTGAIIKTNGSPVDDVNKIVGTIAPAQMSPDVKQLQDDLIQVTRDLAGAGDIATGSVNPEQASGKAILAVQNAQRSPMTEQKEAFKNFVEDLARIWLDMWTVYSPEGIKLEQEVIDETTGEEYIELVDVAQVTLRELQASVKVDITAVGAFDLYAVELTLENFLKAGYFSAQRVGELRKYAEALPAQSASPKQRLLEICDKIEEEQAKIAEMNARAQVMKQKVQQFLMEDPEAQASQIADLEQGAAMEQPIPDEEVPAV